MYENDGFSDSVIRLEEAEEDELEEIKDVYYRRFVVEDESMSYGEALTLLIALGVMLYLVYALLWPERF